MESRCFISSPSCMETSFLEYTRRDDSLDSKLNVFMIRSVRLHEKKVLTRMTFLPCSTYHRSTRLARRRLFLTELHSHGRRHDYHRSLKNIPRCTTSSTVHGGGPIEKPESLSGGTVVSDMSPSSLLKSTLTLDKKRLLSHIEVSEKSMKCKSIKI